MRTRVILASIIALAWALTAGCATTGVAQAAASSRTTEAEVAELMVAIQVGLVAVGHDPGPIDGKGGPRTYAALEAYAKGAGIALNRATLPLVLQLLYTEAAKALTQELARRGDRGDDEARQGVGGQVRNAPYKQW